MSNVLALITARGGSKSIPHKNLATLAGQPLIAYTIQAAIRSARVERTVVSTDDEEIADVSRKLGAEVPFLRPAELARDDTPTLPVMQHLLDQLDSSEGYRPWAVALLQPTSPLRTERHIDEAVEVLEESDADSVVSVIEVPHNFNPVSLLRIEDERLIPYLEGEGSRVLRRQDKPPVFARNGPVVIVSKRRTLMELNDLYGEDCRPYLMDYESSLDIDGPYDLAIANFLLSGGSQQADSGSRSLVEPA